MCLLGFSRLREGATACCILPPNLPSQVTPAHMHACQPDAAQLSSLSCNPTLQFASNRSTPVASTYAGVAFNSCRRQAVRAIRLHVRKHLPSSMGQRQFEQLGKLILQAGCVAGCKARLCFLLLQHVSACGISSSVMQTDYALTSVRLVLQGKGVPTAIMVQHMLVCGLHLLVCVSICST